MAAPSPTFTTELAEIVELLATVDRRLRALFDMAEYEELPLAIAKRLVLKANGIEVQRAGLEEILEGKV